MNRPFRLTAPEPSELDLHAACASALDALLLDPARWWPNLMGQIQLTPDQMARLARIGLKAGFPDAQILHAGRIYFLEFKARGGRLSKTRIVRTKHGALRQVEGQEDVFPRLLAAGAADIAVVTSLDELLAVLARWQIPLRSH
jgi:hypothetical protein